MYILVLSRYQNFCIRYRYQWKSTVLGTKEKQKMLIKKHTIFINKNQCNSLYLSIVISMKNSKEVSPQFNLSFNEI